MTLNRTHPQWNQQRHCLQILFQKTSMKIAACSCENWASCCLMVRFRVNNGDTGGNALMNQKKMTRKKNVASAQHQDNNEKNESMNTSLDAIDKAGKSVKGSASDSIVHWTLSNELIAKRLKKAQPAKSRKKRLHLWRRKAFPLKWVTLTLLLKTMTVWIMMIQ